MLGRGRIGGGGGQYENNLDRGAGRGGGAAHMGVQTKGFTLFSQFPKERPSEIRKSTGAEKSVLHRKSTQQNMTMMSACAIIYSQM